MLDINKLNKLKYNFDEYFTIYDFDLIVRLSSTSEVNTR